MAWYSLYTVIAMRTKITETKLYTFAELSDAAQANALEKESEAQGEFWNPEHDGSFEDFERVAAILGITFRTRDVKFRNGSTRPEPCIYYSGFCSQGDGACFEGTYEYKKGASKAIRDYTGDTDDVLRRIADDLAKLQKPWFYGLQARMTHSGHYSHSGCMSVELLHKWDSGYGYEGDTPKTFEDATLPEDELTELMRNFADWMYRQLEKEYEYRTSERACRKYLEGNTDMEFEEDGTPA